MTDTVTYTHACDDVLREIERYSPHARMMLDKIREKTGCQWAFYAAVIIASLEARVQTEGVKVLETVGLESLRLHTFFEFGSIYDDAHILFMNAFEAYRIDSHRRHTHLRAAFS